MRRLQVRWPHDVQDRFLLTLAGANAVTILLFIARAIDASNLRYSFLLWNLLLGWVPLIIAWWLVKRLKKTSWLLPSNLVLSAIWLVFLPNSFYLISDLIHLRATGEVGLLYDVVMFFAFTLNAYILGFISVFMIHEQLLRRIRRTDAHLFVTFVLLSSSFAIYLGRVLRWNSWDLLFSPFGILFDVSGRILEPGSHPDAFVTTGTFFLLLSSSYAMCWQLVAFIRQAANPNSRHNR